MSTRKIPGSEDGRCVRLTTYHLLVLNVKKIRGLNLPNPHGSVQACSGTPLLVVVVVVVVVVAAAQYAFVQLFFSFPFPSFISCGVVYDVRPFLCL
jgi:hypothetical protein